MKTKMMQISDLTYHPENVRKHPKAQMEELKRSIKQFGLYKPAVVDEDGYILAGNGLVKAAEELGEKEVPVYEMTELTKDQKRKLMLADNKIFTLGVDDYDAIDEVMSKVEDFDIPGFSREDLEAIYGQGQDDAEKFGVDEETLEEKRRRQETHENEGPPQSFQEEKQRAEQEAQEDNHVVCPNCGMKIYNA